MNLICSNKFVRQFFAEYIYHLFFAYSSGRRIFKSEICVYIFCTLFSLLRFYAVCTDKWFWNKYTIIIIDVDIWNHNIIILRPLVVFLLFSRVRNGFFFSGKTIVFWQYTIIYYHYRRWYQTQYRHKFR